MHYENLTTILQELLTAATAVKAHEVQVLEQEILQADRIFIAGAGRSGFVARAFANRLVHLGFTDYFVGESTTPAIGSTDLLIINSGSGLTQGMINTAQIARQAQARIALITIHPQSVLGELADVVVKLPGASSRAHDVPQKISIQPNGSAFEQLTFLLYDSLVVDLKKIKHLSQKQLDQRHANLE